MFCSQCGKVGAENDKFCSGCGCALAPSETGDAVAASSASGATVVAPTSSPAAVASKGKSAVVAAHKENEDYYKAAIGERGQAYYLKCFFNFNLLGKADISWNWPAFFITPFWLLYRKMWLYAAIYLLSWVGMLFVLNASSVQWLNATFYTMVFVILPPLFANAAYYRHCHKQIAKAKSLPYDKAIQLEWLAGKGGVSIPAFLAAAVPVALFIAIGASSSKG